MIDNKQGEATTPEDLFTHCVALAEMTDRSLKADRALKDEIKREHTAVINGLSKVEQLYAPNQVIRTAEQARAALAEFKQEAEDTIMALKRQGDDMLKKAGRRWIVCIVFACACLTAAVVFSRISFLVSTRFSRAAAKSRNSSRRKMHSKSS